MLGFKMNDTFQNIIYFNGNGRDHCELVEGYELGAEVTSQSIHGTYATGTWDYLQFYKSLSLSLSLSLYIYIYIYILYLRRVISYIKLL